MTPRLVRSFTVAAFLLAALAAVPVQALPDFTELVEAEHRAVVNISTTREPATGDESQSREELLRRFFGDGLCPYRDRTALGSGFIISEDGYILTNAHIVNEADEVVVSLHDRRQYDGEVVGNDERSDVALLKIDDTGLPHVRIGDPAELRVGSWVLAIGSPFGFDHSVTAGIVSAKGRSLPDENYVPFIQTDVAINPGNSGGPLFNAAGEVVGINAQILSQTGGSMGVSFTIPIDVAMEVADQLRDQGEVTRGWLGVIIQEVTRDLAESFGMERTRGALVSRVLPGSPAEEGGLRVGDVILTYDGREVPKSSALPAMVGRTDVGSSAQLSVLREGQRRQLSVRIGRLPDQDALVQRVEPDDPSAAADGGRLGLDIGAVDDAARERLGLGVSGGVQVMAPPEGAAAEAGMREGDVIVLMNARPIAGVEDFRRNVAELPSGSKVALLVQRSDGPQFIAIEVPPADSQAE